MPRTTARSLRLATAAALAASAIAAAPGSASAADCANADARPGTVSTTTAETAVRCLINAERTSRGLRAFAADDRLDRTARSFSRQLVRQSFFGHDAPSGSTPISRIRSTGYLTGLRRWSIGENLGWGEAQLGTPEALVRAWMNSPPHRRNVLDRRFREIGVGISHGAPRQVRGRASTLSASFGMAVPRGR